MLRSVLTTNLCFNSDKIITLYMYTWVMKLLPCILNLYLKQLQEYGGLV